MRLIAFMLTTVCLLIITSCNQTPKQAVEIIEEVIPPKFEYGICIDSLNVIHATVRPNEFLSDILLKYNVDYAVIDQLARTTRDTFDVRKIRAGTPNLLESFNRWSCCFFICLAHVIVVITLIKAHLAVVNFHDAGYQAAEEMTIVAH